MDGTFSFQSLASFERCPYAYRLDLTEANKGLYAQEFLDKVVRNAIAALNRRRLCGHIIDKDAALSAFWNSWDLQTELNPLCHETDKAELLKIGEKCMTIAACASTATTVRVSRTVCAGRARKGALDLLDELSLNRMPPVF